MLKFFYLSWQRPVLLFYIINHFNGTLLKFSMVFCCVLKKSSEQKNNGLNRADF